MPLIPALPLLILPLLEVSLSWSKAFSKTMERRPLALLAVRSGAVLASVYCAYVVAWVVYP